MGLRLLVVDDDADTRDLLCAMLRPYKVDVSAAGSMAEAISVLRNRRFDILLSDIAMPRHDGYELIETVRRDNHPSVSGLGPLPSRRMPMARIERKPSRQDLTTT
jgi:CheY-like chemotaxis protein